MSKQIPWEKSENEIRDKTLYTKEKHLDYIVNVIDRMARCSFMCKGWAIALAGALIAFDVKVSYSSVSFITILPLLIIWWLDAYYLRQEKLFRELFDDVRLRCFSQNPYSMNVDSFRQKSTFKNMFNKTEIMFYVAILITLLRDFIKQLTSLLL